MAPPDPAHLWRPGTCPAVQALSWTQDTDTSAVPGDQNRGEAERLARERSRQVALVPQAAQSRLLPWARPVSSHLNSWSHVDLRYVGDVLGAIEPTLACCQHRDGGS